MQLLGQHLQAPGDFPQLGRAVVTTTAAGATHQLQVVDHDQAQLAALARQAPRIGAQLGRRQPRRLVDVQRNLAELFHRLGQARPLIVLQLAGTQIALVHLADGTHDTHRQLGGAHFHREDGDRQAFVERHVLGNVHRERGLAHGRARRQHDHVAGLQPTGHTVQVGKAGGNTGHIHRVVRHLLHPVQQVAHQGVHALEALLHARAFLADGEDLLLGLVQNALHRLALGVERIRGDLVAHRQQFAQDALLAHDLRITADVGRAGHVLGQLVEVEDAPHLFGLAHALQVLEDRDHVGRLAVVDQLADGGIDLLVLVAVEIALGQQVPHPVPGVVVQQQTTQHAGLGLHGVLRQAQFGHLLVLGGSRRAKNIIIQRRHHRRHGRPTKRQAHDRSAATGCRHPPMRAAQRRHGLRSQE